MVDFGSRHWSLLLSVSVGIGNRCRKGAATIPPMGVDATVAKYWKMTGLYELLGTEKRELKMGIGEFLDLIMRKCSFLLPGGSGDLVGTMISTGRKFIRTMFTFNVDPQWAIRNRRYGEFPVRGRFVEASLNCG